VVGGTAKATVPGAGGRGGGGSGIVLQAARRLRGCHESHGPWATATATAEMAAREERGTRKQHKSKSTHGQYRQGGCAGAGRGSSPGKPVGPAQPTAFFLFLRGWVIQFPSAELHGTRHEAVGARQSCT
jgi:hypothetical protein